MKEIASYVVSHCQECKYLFVFEYGFLKRKENGRDKFVLVKWQEYMEVSAK